MALGLAISTGTGTLIWLCPSTTQGASPRCGGPEMGPLCKEARFACDLGDARSELEQLTTTETGETTLRLA